MAQYTVNYEGWLSIEAKTSDEAESIANKMLSEFDITNDGQEGEWMLAEVEEEEEEW